MSRDVDVELYCEMPKMYVTPNRESERSRSSAKFELEFVTPTAHHCFRMGSNFFIVSIDHPSPAAAFANFAAQPASPASSQAWRNAGLAAPSAAATLAAAKARISLRHIFYFFIASLLARVTACPCPP